MLWTRIAIIFLWAFLLPNKSIAGEFSFAAYDGNKIFGKFEGDIRPGDADKILSAIQQQKFTYLYSKGLIVNSRGGDILEALKIARLVENSGWRVDVQENGICASSCFLIYASAPIRFSSGNIVVHRPYFDMSEAKGWDAANYEKSYRAAIRDVRQYLSERLVPDYLIEKMMSKGSADGYTLTFEDLIQVGFLSAAVSEYGKQLCGMPTGRIATSDEIEGVNKCTDVYLEEARIKFAFAESFREASAELKKLDAHMRQLRQRISPSSDEYQAALQAAKNAVDSLPPKEWLESVRKASEFRS